MKYATLMVHMAIEHSNAARLQVAGDLAECFQAKVIGICACDHSPPPYYTDAAVSVVGDLIEADRAYLARKTAELEEQFQEALKGRSKDTEWRTGLSRPTEFAAQEARAADLIISGSNKDGTFLDPFRHLNISSLLMTAGRPILTVPPEIDAFRRRHILVAWKDTRESRRAISDALPILANAGEVRVVEVVENGSSDSAQERVDDVARWLKQHGISASARALGAVENAANDMETIAADMSADLIVAGAYGHSRFSQWVFGGVTDKLLKQSIRCTLLSH